jgi:hypothetical protein
MRYLLPAVLFLVSCGKENPAPPIDPVTQFVVKGIHIEWKGTVKSKVTVEEAKAAVGYAVKVLEE